SSSYQRIHNDNLKGKKIQGGRPNHCVPEIPKANTYRRKCKHENHCSCDNVSGRTCSEKEQDIRQEPEQEPRSSVRKVPPGDKSTKCAQQACNDSKCSPHKYALRFLNFWKLHGFSSRIPHTL